MKTNFIDTDGLVDEIPIDEPLPYVDLAADLKPRPWHIPERIPRRNVTLLSGIGSIGKSTLLMQLFGATALTGAQWLGMYPEQGPGLYLTAEEEDNEVRHRLEAVAESLGTTRRRLIDNGLKVLSYAGKDAILAEPDRNGIIKPTPRFARLREEILRLKPKLIGIDAAADVFAGNEINRAQTRQFITMLRGLAMDTDGAVILVAHPSLQGITSDSGLSGSTAWHNSVRARMYFKNSPGNDKSLRVLEVRKNNYGPEGADILLRWRDGVYVVEPGKGSIEKLTENARVDDLFLKLLRRFTESGRNVSDNPGRSYAPSKFADDPEAKASNTTNKQLAEAMARLFAAGKLRVIKEGRPSHPTHRLAETGGQGAEIIPFAPPSQRPANDGQRGVGGRGSAIPQTPYAGVGRGQPTTANGQGVGKEPLAAVGPANASPEPITAGEMDELRQCSRTSDGGEETTPTTAPQPDDPRSVAPAYDLSPREPYERQRIGNSRFQIMSAVLETDACEHCRRTEGERYLIRDPHQGVAAHVLHEKCAPDFYHSEVPPDHEV